MTFVEAAAQVGVVAGAITGAAGVLSMVRHVYRTTAGRRRALSRKLARLAPTMQVSYFVHVLGEPQQRHGADERQVAIWATEDAYIQAIARADGTVTRWSVTTRSPRFRPTFFRGHTITAGGDSIEIKLARTRFAELPGNPSWVRGDLGARRFHYDEGFYFGNPGNYQWFVYSLNDAGWVNDHHLVSIADQEQGVDVNEEQVAIWLARADVQEARRSAAVNTITVGAPFEVVQPDESTPGMGSDHDIVRIIPSHGTRSRWRSWRRSVMSRIRRWWDRQQRYPWISP